MIRVLCLGAGGHAAVVLDALRLMGGREEVAAAGLITRDGAPGETLGVPVLGSDADLARVAAETRAEWFVVGAGSLHGGDRLRERLFELGVAHGLKPFAVVHPSAIVSPNAEVGAGAAVMAGAVIQPRATIGANAIINTRAGVDHDCVIGPHAHIAPGVTLSGDVHVGHGAHVGTGASVRQGVRIGDRATVGAGAVLVDDCLAGVTMVGVPARTRANGGAT